MTRASQYALYWKHLPDNILSENRVEFLK